MLLQFAVENYTCFAEKVVLSLMAVPGEQRPDGQAVDVPGVGQVLRSVVLYGPNASGKSNLVRAFEAVRSMTVDGVPPGGKLPVRPHRLDPARLKQPSSFELELLVDGVRYSYGIRATTTAVVEEWLDRVDGDQHVSIFERTATGIRLGPGLGLDERRREFYGFVAEGTRPEQPFLAELRTRNATEWVPLLAWFGMSQAVLASETWQARDLVAALLEHPVYRDQFVEVLREADTGVRGLRCIADSGALQQRIDEWDHFSTEEAEALAASMSIRVEFLHATAEGSVTPLGLDELSDGTRRLVLAVIPMMLAAPHVPITFLDELDQSFHTELTRHLMELINRRRGSGQFVVTTHDTNLLDAGVFGRDAIWFVEKDADGAARLYSLAEFDRAQLDALTGRIEQGYLQGRFGAIPVLGDPARLKWSAK